MTRLVFTYGTIDYQEKSAVWSASIHSTKAEIDRLLSLKESSYFACGTQEIVSIPESEQVAMKVLKQTLSQWRQDDDKDKRIASQQVSVW